MSQQQVAPAPERVNPRRDGRYWRYREALLAKIDVTSKGLEIGAFDLPFVTRAEANVVFADWLPAEELRKLAAKVAGHSPEFIEEVDFVLSQAPLDSLPSDFAWAATAHLIEHVPDLIGWLKTIGDRLLPRGVLFCVIPDGRFTFDIHRPVSTLGKILQDHRDDQRRPAFRDVFDAVYYGQETDAVAVWDGRAGPNVHHHNDFHAAWTRAAADQELQVECHCNVFTPASFGEIITALSAANLIPFELEEVSATPQYWADFSTVLRKKGEPQPLPVPTPVLPEDFDPDLYLRLNPDVLAAGDDPKAHYLHNGFYEGRRWREEI
jgi:hypothetical protein